MGSEALISAFSYMNNFHTLMFRFPNVIGPRLTHGVIFDFMKRLRENPKELTILGDGRQCKPYLYVNRDCRDCLSGNGAGECEVQLYRRAWRLERRCAGFRLQSG